MPGVGEGDFWWRGIMQRDSILNTDKKIGIRVDDIKHSIPEGE
jgi:hypothetical protein